MFATTSFRSYAYGAVPVVFSGPSMRSSGFPTTFSWSIGLVVAGVSNFMSGLRFRYHPGERSLDERHLERVVLRGARAGEQPRRHGCRTARKLGLRGLDAPWLVRDPAERHAAGAIRLHHRGHGHQGERVRRAIAHLAIEVPPAERLRQR